jgi:hypothetical protein
MRWTPTEQDPSPLVDGPGIAPRVRSLVGKGATESNLDLIGNPWILSLEDQRCDTL